MPGEVGGVGEAVTGSDWGEVVEWSAVLKQALDSKTHLACRDTLATAPLAERLRRQFLRKESAESGRARAPGLGHGGEALRKGGRGR